MLCEKGMELQVLVCILKNVPLCLEDVLASCNLLIDLGYVFQVHQQTSLQDNYGNAWQLHSFNNLENSIQFQLSSDQETNVGNAWLGHYLLNMNKSRRKYFWQYMDMPGPGLLFMSLPGSSIQTASVGPQVREVSCTEQVMPFCSSL